MVLDVCNWSLCPGLPVWERLIEACSCQSELATSICRFSPTRHRPNTTLYNAQRTHPLNNNHNRLHDTLLHHLPKTSHTLFRSLTHSYPNRRLHHRRHPTILATIPQLIWSTKLRSNQHAHRHNWTRPFHSYLANNVQTRRFTNFTKAKQQDLGANHPTGSNYWTFTFIWQRTRKRTPNSSRDSKPILHSPIHLLLVCMAKIKTKIRTNQHY